MRGGFARWLLGSGMTAAEEAQEKLAAMVAERAASPAIVQYRKRRAAAVKGRAK